MPNPNKNTPISNIIYLFNWVNNSSFERHFVSENSLIQFVVGNLINFAPFRNIFNFTTKLYKYTFSGVSGLFAPSSPATVFFTVVSVYIYAINRGLFLSKLFYVRFVTLIHIFFEFFKRIPQTFYSSTSVIFVTTVTCIITSSFQMLPYSVESRVRQSVYRFCVATKIFQKTSARFHTSIFKILSRYVRDVATFAQTFPINSVGLTSLKIFNNLEPKKRFSAQINKLSHIFMPKLDTRFVSRYPISATKLIMI